MDKRLLDTNKITQICFITDNLEKSAAWFADLTGMPAVQFAPIPVDRQSFASEADRDRLAQVALKAYRRLVQVWQLSGQQAADLLGVSISTWERLKPEGQDRPLSQDQMTRISALVGIYKALHLLFADDMR